MDWNGQQVSEVQAQEVKSGAVYYLFHYRHVANANPQKVQ